VPDDRDQPGKTLEEGIMLEGCVPWPADLAARYRARGWWEGITIPEMLARSAGRHPGKTALVSGDLRLSYRSG